MFKQFKVKRISQILTYLKRKKISIIWISSMLLSVAYSACTREPEPAESTPIPKLTAFQISFPNNFPPMNMSSDNPLTEEGVALGRKLYYDSLLHPLKAMSCAGCHLQNLSFSRPGNDGVLPHVNLAWRRYFLWNGGVEGSLEDAMEFEIEEFFATDLKHIRHSEEYRSLFKKLYGTDEINTDRVSKVLAQFLASLISNQSKFDRVLFKQAEFTPAEAAGAELFFSEKGDCFHCHPPPLFTDNLFHNVGIDTAFEGRDQGRFKVTGNPMDMGRFLTPTLRNITVTAPYYHDGRFTDLKEVIEHYNSGVRKSPTLDFLLTKNNTSGSKNLSETDIQNLWSFLKTLEDTSF